MEMKEQRATPGRPTIPEVVALLKVYCAKPGNGVGGALHIVLDDGNIDDRHVLWCKAHATEIGDQDGAVIAEKLVSMTKTQRKRLAAMMYTDYA